MPLKFAGPAEAALSANAAAVASLVGRATTLEENSLTLDETADSIIISGDVSATRTQALFVAPYPAELAQVSMSFAGAVAASDLNYWTVELKRYRAGAAATIGTKTTKVTAGEAIAAFTEWHFDLVAFSDAALAKGDIVAVTFTPTGTPAALSNTCVTFRTPSTDNVPIEPDYIINDTFTRADQVGLGTADTGQVWAGSGWDIVSDEAKSNAVGQVYVETSVADLTVEVEIASHGSSTIGPVVRYVDGSNYIGFTNIRGFKRVGGTLTNFAVFDAGAVVESGDTIRVTCDGTTLTVFKDAGSTGTFTQIATYTEATHLTATKHGLRAGLANGRAESFRAYA